jgi:IS30 family transposase
MTLHPDTSVVEMDTVEGVKGGKVLLTLLFRQSKLMLAFLLKSKTQEEVLKVFRLMEAALGTITFKQTFPLILTDNGSEFINPILLETGFDSMIRTSLYYCDPRASFQKGGLEKNHEFIRYFAPQGTAFDNLTQTDITRMINHINNTARDGLNGKTPFKLASVLLDQSVIDYLELQYITPDEVTLKPALLFNYSVSSFTKEMNPHE